MTEVIVTSDDPGEEAVEAAVEVAAVEGTAKVEGMVLGEISAGITQLADAVRQIQTELDELRAGQAEVAVEVEDAVEALEAVLAVEVADAIEDAVEDAAEGSELDDLAAVEAAEVAELAEVADAVESVEDEVVPATRRTHWFFRPGNEWRRD